MSLTAVAPIADALSGATLALACVTAVLAVATVALAVITHRGINSAGTDAEKQIEAMLETAADEINAIRETAAEQVAAARDELDAAHRPLLIEVYPTGPIYPDMGARDNPNIAPGGGSRHIPQTIELAFDGTVPVEIDPRITFVRFERGMAFVSVPLRNVGRGLAVLDGPGISLAGTALGALKAPPVARRVRVPPNETTRLLVIAEYHPSVLIPPDHRWLLSVPYSDFAGRQQAVAAVQLGYRGQDAGTGEWNVTGVGQP